MMYLLLKVKLVGDAGHENLGLRYSLIWFLIFRLEIGFKSAPAPAIFEIRDEGQQQADDQRDERIRE
jgi:hypothetical protein